MKIYKVTAEFNSYVSMQYPYLTTLDGLLSYPFVAEIYQNKEFRAAYLSRLSADDSAHIKFIKSLPYTQPPQKIAYSENEVIRFSAMPIALDRNGVFHATSLQLHGVGSESLAYYRRQFPLKHGNMLDFGKRKRQLDIGKGLYKSINSSHHVVSAKSAVGYIETDFEFVALLERYVTGIGKKRNTGHGEVRRWQIEESDFDFSRPMRPYPSKFFPIVPEGYDIFDLTCQPPYHQSTSDLCILPEPNLLIKTYETNIEN